MGHCHFKEGLVVLTDCVIIFRLTGIVWYRWQNRGGHGGMGGWFVLAQYFYAY